jgi:hypothetical protein
MKYIVRHFEGGFQVFESDDETETLIASFHKEPRVQTGQRSLAQQRAEEYCDFLNQSGLNGAAPLDFD